MVASTQMGLVMTVCFQLTLEQDHHEEQNTRWLEGAIKFR